MGLPDPGPTPTDAEPVNVAAMQIQLMEDTYFALRLDQYANARDNRGWMNLFRRWGRCRIFQNYFRELQSNYSNDFVAFYCNYIQGWDTIDRFPLPHAWDVGPDLEEQYAHPSAVICWERRAPGLFQDPGRQEIREPEPGQAFLPPAGHPVARQHGDSGLVDEDRSPTPPVPPKSDSTKE